MTERDGTTRRNVVWGMSTLSALVLLFGYHTSTSSAEATTATGTTTGTAAGAATGASTGSSSTTGSSSGSSGSGGSGGSGTGSTSTGTSGGSDSSASSTTVTGEAAQTRWGPVQVQLTISSGKVTAVDVLQQPDENQRDVQINAQALPLLVQETLSAQSAKIDMVSGATYTSDGYLTSLQSALDQAGLS